MNRTRKRKLYHFLPTLTVLPAIILFSTSSQAYSPASGVSFGVSYINKWEEGYCKKGTPLSYTDDQMNMLASKLQSLGASRSFRFSNTNVYASDFTEDGKGGNDKQYVDSVDFFAYSGHGGASNGQFCVPVCGGEGNNYFCSKSAVWGEPRSYSVGGKSSYSIYPGRLRWAMFATCYSGDDPYNHWHETAQGTNFEYLFGYQGTSADSYFTDEVGYDWAENAFKKDWSFKASWFDAVEDFWIDDTGVAVAFDTTCDAAKNRRDYFRVSKKYGNRRKTGSGSHPPVCVAWAWHRG